MNKNKSDNSTPIFFSLDLKILIFLNFLLLIINGSCILFRFQALPKILYYYNFIEWIETKTSPKK
ncbi:hypothetical protein ATP_00476 [Candidatus Phytoplasma mali]|uniref:Uncharacterized protein n=1 Tax=Phytoplasma mali (strain AT) TaxID=482235 RepID=B3R045_PHYMT|nr:hypothetical protein [Candidatus Phytoplasma mali]CAP18209.1 hypothetical protein ATP_00022 [Candidatus Phytoplasma mali]CAP18663.1 hypothetical protein ATP_00476 [Candidatus Phytoplasma mali]